MSQLCPDSDERVLVRGMPRIELFPPNFLDKNGSPNRLRYVDLTGTRSEASRFDRVRDQAVVALAQQGVFLKELKAGSGVAKPIGSGRYAEVFALREDPDYVVKISGDKSEAVAWARILEAVEDGETSWSCLPSLARVKCVYVVRPRRATDKDLYVIIVERCSRTSKAERDLIECVDRLVLLGPGEEPSCVQAPYLAKEDAIKRALARRSIKNSVKKAENFIETLQNLAKIGVFVYDIHGENVMIGGDDEWKITDVGVAEVDAPVLMRVLP